jgi:PBP1b-binding outer membrane lipoprotein LpoB
MTKLIAICIGLLILSGCSNPVYECQKREQKAFAEKNSRMPDRDEMLAITKACADR